ncbi:MAG: class I SAM-dependent methyltransferase [Nitrososphaerota archaeon]|nr:class I SAM-dependent methyltransferase [Nitrososphaerota archaeon]
MASPPDDRKVPLFVTDNLLRRIVSDPKKTASRYVSPGGTVADLGCGAGYFTIPMAELAGTGGKVYAVDFDERAVGKVAAKAEERGLGRVVEARASSAADVRFIPDRSVDFVFAHGLLCCMKDHSGALREMRRILKSDGRMYLSVTKFGRKKDPRAVGADEWKNVLDGFRVLGSGGGLLTRWALVSLPDGPRAGGVGEVAETGTSSGCC